jgi:hypothetical protein
MKLGLHLPINSVSFGQVSSVLLKTLFEREKAREASKVGSSDDPYWYLFPIGQPDLSSQNEDKEFQIWLQQLVNRAWESYSRDIPIFKLWHINGSLESYSKKQVLFTFYELDRPTKIELNIAKNSATYFSSQYSIDVFESYGVNTKFLPLAFDSYNFKTLNKKFHADERITFNLCGKLEKRKHHAKVIQTWIKKYGNNPRFSLQCAIYNPFLVQQTPQGIVDHNNRMVGEILGGNKPFNVNFYPHMKENTVYNEFLNSGDIILGMSGGEGWGLPEFHSVALGKHAVILNAHGYKSWANEETVTFVNPNGKIDSADGIHFAQGQPFNQGNLFDWDAEEFLVACDTAIAKVEANRVNTKGLELQQTFNKERFADGVIEALKTV